MSEPKSCSRCRHLALQPGPNGLESICAFGPPTPVLITDVTWSDDESGNKIPNVRVIGRASAFPPVQPSMFCSKYQRKLEVATDADVLDINSGRRSDD